MCKGEEGLGAQTSLVHVDGKRDALGSDVTWIYILDNL